LVFACIGTTRDAVDEVIETMGERFGLLIRLYPRKGKTHLMAEKLSVVMARKNIEDADIALFLRTLPRAQRLMLRLRYADESGGR